MWFCLRSIVSDFAFDRSFCASTSLKLKTKFWSPKFAAHFVWNLLNGKFLWDGKVAIVSRWKGLAPDELLLHVVYRTSIVWLSPSDWIEVLRYARGHFYGDFEEFPKTFPSSPGSVGHNGGCKMVKISFVLVDFAEFPTASVVRPAAHSPRIFLLQLRATCARSVFERLTSSRANRLVQTSSPFLRDRPRCRRSTRRRRRRRSTPSGRSIGSVAMAPGVPSSSSALQSSAGGKSGTKRSISKSRPERWVDRVCGWAPARTFVFVILPCDSSSRVCYENTLTRSSEGR